MMATSPPWVSELQIDPTTFLHWQQATPPGVSVTFWCLLQGSVDPTVYLNWARNFYGLTSLHPGFFTRPPDPQFYQNLIGLGGWSRELIPVQQWEGKLYVACVEPADPPPTHLPVQYVLADAIGLDSFWKLVQPLLYPKPVVPSPAVPTAAVVTDTPDGIDPQLLGLTTPAPAPIIPLPAEASPVATDAPEGILEISRIGDLPVFTDPTTDVARETAPEAATMPSPTPTPLEHPVTAELPPIPNAADLADVEVQSQVVLAPEATLTEVAAAPQVPTAAPAFSPTNPLAGVQAPAQLELARSEDEIVAYIFAELRQKFTASQILLFTGDGLKTWKWSLDWNPVSQEAFETVDLHRPSIFRIVQRTGLPYHGYLAASAINSRFFQLWGHPQLPEHVTLTPIRSAGHLIGMVLAVGSAEQFHPRSLSFVEDLTKQLVGAIERKAQAA